ncbi:GNAT family N-acetyltransferase [Streptomyces sp. NPDC002659]|uniref:GNAT family N-acetyltransferase n=1 Tax=Streptomyces sp. NPDC002659 TaxID=3364656 RepID=UPI0036B35CCB
MSVPIRLPGLQGGLTARPMAADDHDVVAALIDADWLPGRLPARQRTPEPNGETFVVVDARERVAGAVRCRVRPADRAGLIVWLHGRENFGVMAALVVLARVRLGRRLLYACTGPATATGIPGLPVEHRPETERALMAAGFSPVSAQRYFLRDLTMAPPAPPGYPLADVNSIAAPPGWQLELTDTDGAHIASAILRAPTPETAGMAVLWQLAVRTEHRRKGVATHLLAQCLHHAAAHGAHHVTADAADGDIPAARLLAASGFLPLDTLTVYHHP